MAAVGQDQHVEVLVGLDQGIDHLHGQRRMDVVIHIPGCQQQFPLQIAGQVGVSLLDEIIAMQTLFWLINHGASTAVGQQPHGKRTEKMVIK
jgi:hypothetical protein